MDTTVTDLNSIKYKLDSIKYQLWIDTIKRENGGEITYRLALNNFKKMLSNPSSSDNTESQSRYVEDTLKNGYNRLMRNFIQQSGINKAEFEKLFHSLMNLIENYTAELSAYILSKQDLTSVIDLQSYFEANATVYYMSDSARSVINEPLENYLLAIKQKSKDSDRHELNFILDNIEIGRLTPTMNDDSQFDFGISIWAINRIYNNGRNIVEYIERHRYRMGLKLENDEFKSLKIKTLRIVETDSKESITARKLQFE